MTKDSIEGIEVKEYLVRIWFSTRWLIFFSFLVSSYADDINEFEIEGISIGDSLLTYMSVQQIKSGIENTLPVAV